MIKVYDNATGRLVGKINEEQHEFLMEMLEEESTVDDNYFLDSATLDYLAESGADEELIEMLTEALGGSDGIEIRIVDDAS